MSSTHTLAGGKPAIRRLRRELKAALEDFQQSAHPSEQEFLLRVIEDALDLRGNGPEDGLMCIQTAFNQNLKRSSARFVRVHSAHLADVLAYIRWRSQAEAE
jgi:hypothetical protein